MSLRLGARLTLVGGKGGVGKTTMAAALAVRQAEAGDLIVISVDPAHSLGDALATPLSAELKSIPGVPRLRALEVNPAFERASFLEAHRDAFAALLEDGTYLDAEDVDDLLDQAIPGLDELAALLRLRELLAIGTPLVVDTAPSGHTLRLLDTPELAREWLQAFQAMEERRVAVSQALVGAHRPDAAAELLRRLHQDLNAIEELLHDPVQTRFVLVTSREPVVLAETLRLHDELTRRGVAVGGVVVNRAEGELPTFSGEEERMVGVPQLETEPVGIAALRRLGGRLLGEIEEELPAAPITLTPGVRQVGRYFPPPDRSLYLVAGKGGVGKSTVAAATALRLRDAGRRVLLLGLDPAGSLSDLLLLPVTDIPAEVPLADGLWVHQLRAGPAWNAFRARYQAEAERIFGGLLSGAAAPGSDQAVVERLVELAPPGIDELAGLMEVIDALELRRYDAVVVDAAPTGHFLRLIEMPEVALGWTHEIMRLLLKYREVVASGALAEQLLEFAKQLRSFSARLRDAAQCWPVIVTLPEALSATETRRLMGRLGDLSIPIGTLLINRFDSAQLPFALVELLPHRELPELAAASSWSAGPRGLPELRDFAAAWQRLSQPALTD